MIQVASAFRLSRPIPPALMRWAIPVAGWAGFGAFAIIYRYFPGLYDHALAILMKVQGAHPFTDWEWIPASVRCWSEGVDVYIANSCYKPDPSLSWNYPPIWLRATFLKYGENWVNTTAVAATLLFFLSFAAFRRPAQAGALLVALLAALSSATVLEVERANVDILIFLMVVAAVLTAELRLPFRLLGYAVLLFAGLLKLYPLVALIIVLRERFSVVVLVAAASVATVGAMVWQYHAELALMASRLPSMSIFTLQFGARELPAGLGLTTTLLLEQALGVSRAVSERAGEITTQILHPALVLASVAGAFFIWRRQKMTDAIRALDIQTRMFLVAGAALIAGCFFTGQSVLYRGIFLSLALPGLAWFRTSSTGVRSLSRWAEWSIVFVLWVPTLEGVLFVLKLAKRIPYQGDIASSFPGPRLGYVLWLCNEAAWWFIATVFLAVILTFVVESARRWRTPAPA